MHTACWARTSPSRDCCRTPVPPRSAPAPTDTTCIAPDASTWNSSSPTASSTAFGSWAKPSKSSKPRWTCRNGDIPRFLANGDVPPGGASPFARKRGMSPFLVRRELLRIHALTRGAWLPAAGAANDAVGNHCLVPALRCVRCTADPQDRQAQRRHDPQPLLVVSFEPHDVMRGESTVDAGEITTRRILVHWSEHETHVTRRRELIALEDAI